MRVVGHATPHDRRNHPRTGSLTVINPTPDAATKALTKHLTDHGRLIQAGYANLMALAYRDADPVQNEELRSAFFAGAHHAFSNIIPMLDDHKDLSDDDWRCLEQIDAELSTFLADFTAWFLPAEGRA